MHISMIPRGETGKAIHISQDDTNREVEFIPYDQKGLVALTDGQLTAKINSIKGNTISFNQLVENGNFADTSNWNTYLCTLSVSNNIATITDTGGINGNIYSPNTAPKVISGHKYYFTGYVKDNSGPHNNNVLRYRAGSTFQAFNSVNTDWQKYSTIIEATITNRDYIQIECYAFNYGTTQCKNFMCFDLTLMGIDNLTTTAEVEQWLSTHIGDLPYFDYTQGTLISFNGTGLKTTGKNFIDTSNVDTQSTLVSKNADGSLHFKSVSVAQWDNKYLGEFFVQRGTQYRITVSNFKYGRLGFGYINNRAPINGDLSAKNMDGIALSSLISSVALSTSFNVNYTGYVYVWYCSDYNIAQRQDFDANIQVSFVDAPVDYEPYTSNILPLLTSTYFPTGMKSAGSVYEELSDKAYTRVGSVDLGSLTWTYDSSTSSFVSSAIMERANNQVGICSAYENIASWGTFLTLDRVFIMLANQLNEKPIRVKDSRYTDATTFKQAMTDQNVKLYFELATPAEFDISLDLTYPIWNGGTEQILPVNGSTPSTAPIKANITYPDRTEDTEFLYKQTTFDWVFKSWSFVCKNITQALSVVSNKLKGTIPSGMTNASGKYDMKLKMTDNDGVCYSEKIDLIVEKKP